VLQNYEKIHFSQVPDGCNLETSCELLDNIKEVVSEMLLRHFVHG